MATLQLKYFVRTSIDPQNIIDVLQNSNNSS